MKWPCAIGLIVVLSISCVFYSMMLGRPACSSSDSDTNYQYTIGQTIISTLHFFIGATTRTGKKFNTIKRNTLNRYPKKTRIKMFKGRAAEKDYAIFNMLVDSGPLSIGEIQRKLNKLRGLEVSYYASLNKRIHALERAGYIIETKPPELSGTGFRASLYEVRVKFYLAIYLNGKNQEDVWKKIGESSALLILTDLMNAEMNAKSGSGYSAGDGFTC